MEGVNEISDGGGVYIPPRFKQNFKESRCDVLSYVMIRFIKLYGLPAL